MRGFVLPPSEKLERHLRGIEASAIIACGAASFRFRVKQDGSTRVRSLRSFAPS
jgi:hypothetical protein